MAIVGQEAIRLHKLDDCSLMDQTDRGALRNGYGQSSFHYAGTAACSTTAPIRLSQWSIRRDLVPAPDNRSVKDDCTFLPAIGVVGRLRFVMNLHRNTVVESCVSWWTFIYLTILRPLSGEGYRTRRQGTNGANTVQEIGA